MQVPALLQAYQDLRCVTYPLTSLSFLSSLTHAHAHAHAQHPSPTHRNARLPRASTTQDSSRLNQKIFHLPDGPAQRARDKAMRATMAAVLDNNNDERGGGNPSISTDGNPNQRADRTKNRIQFGYDAYAEVERWWSAGGRERIEALAGNDGDRGADGGRAGVMTVKARL